MEDYNEFSFEKINNFKDRMNNLGIKTSVVGEKILSESKLRIEFPFGEKFRMIEIPLSTPYFFDNINKHDWAGIVPLEEYNCFWDKHANEIICEVLGDTQLIDARLINSGKDSKARINGIEISIPSKSDGRISALSIIIDGFNFGPNKHIVIKNVPCKSYSDVCALLDNVINSYFFSLEINTGTLLYLKKRGVFHKDKRAKGNYVKEMNLLKYDDAPLTLYLNALRDGNSKLHKYLGFYHVLEFYFPIFTKQATIENIQIKLKNPSFDWANENHILGIINTISNNRSSSTMDEKRQLENVLQKCLDVDDLCFFIEGNIEYRAMSKKISIISFDLNKDKKIVAENLVSKLTARIYDIRNKVVHKKAGGEITTSDVLSSIYPFSKEEELLIDDIKVIEYVAQQVLIYNSKKMEI